MDAARAAEYDAVLVEAGAAMGAGAQERARVLRRLRAEVRRIERRDFFRPSQREQVRRALMVLADSDASTVTRSLAGVPR